MITKQKCWFETLSSLRDFKLWLDGLPSHKWLGYFQSGCDTTITAQKSDIDSLEAMMMREDCDKNFFVV